MSDGPRRRVTQNQSVNPVVIVGLVVVTFVFGVRDTVFPQLLLDRRVRICATGKGSPSPHSLQNRLGLREVFRSDRDALLHELSAELAHGPLPFTGTGAFTRIGRREMVPVWLPPICPDGAYT